MAAYYRKLDTSFWRDTANDDLTKDEQHLYCYLLTNQSTNLAGIFKIKLKTVLFESLLKPKEFEKAIEGLEAKGKVVYDRETDEFFCTRWHTKYNNTSPTVQKSISVSLSRVNSERLKAIRQEIIDGADYEPPAMEEPQEEERPPAEAYVKILGHLSEVTGRTYKPTTRSYQDLIRRCRGKDRSLTAADFIAVIDEKARQWLKDPEHNLHIRPETLFGTKFPTYLAEANARKPSMSVEKDNPVCPICGIQHVVTNTSHCVRCGFDMLKKGDESSILQYKNDMLEAGLGERLGIIG